MNEWVSESCHKIVCPSPVKLLLMSFPLLFPLLFRIRCHCFQMDISFLSCFLFTTVSLTLFISLWQRRAKTEWNALCREPWSNCLLFLHTFIHREETRGVPLKQSSLKWKTDRMSPSKPSFSSEPHTSPNHMWSKERDILLVQGKDERMARKRERGSKNEENGRRDRTRFKERQEEKRLKRDTTSILIFSPKESRGKGSKRSINIKHSFNVSLFTLSLFSLSVGQQYESHIKMTSLATKEWWKRKWEKREEEAKNRMDRLTFLLTWVFLFLFFSSLSSLSCWGNRNRSFPLSLPLLSLCQGIT